MDFLQVELIFGFVYANSVAWQTEEGFPGSGGNSKLAGNPQPRLWATSGCRVARGGSWAMGNGPLSLLFFGRFQVIL